MQLFAFLSMGVLHVFTQSTIGIDEKSALTTLEAVFIMKSIYVSRQYPSALGSHRTIHALPNLFFTLFGPSWPSQAKSMCIFKALSI